MTQRLGAPCQSRLGSMIQSQTGSAVKCFPVLIGPVFLYFHMLATGYVRAFDDESSPGDDFNWDIDKEKYLFERQRLLSTIPNSHVIAIVVDMDNDIADTDTRTVSDRITPPGSDPVANIRTILGGAEAPPVDLLIQWIFSDPQLSQQNNDVPFFANLSGDADQTFSILPLFDADGAPDGMATSWLNLIEVLSLRWGDFNSGDPARFRQGAAGDRWLNVFANWINIGRRLWLRENPPPDP